METLNGNSSHERRIFFQKYVLKTKLLSLRQEESFSYISFIALLVASNYLQKLIVSENANQQKIFYEKEKKIRLI
jgi:hypothetical protein